MLSHDIMQPYTLVRPIHQGLKYPIIWCEKTEHSHECGTPNLYTICIGSESCLYSIVGFAQLPCFGTLRSAMLAKVALGELLRLCPS